MCRTGQMKPSNQSPSQSLVLKSFTKVTKTKAMEGHKTYATVQLSAVRVRVLWFTH